MRLLLDTHIDLWYLEGSSRLADSEYERIAEADEVYVSAVSVWEAAIKAGLGKLDVNVSDLVDGVNESGFSQLPVTMSHVAKVAHLPPIHADPFDRLLIAQALEGPLQLITADAVIARYSDLVHLVM